MSFSKIIFLSFTKFRIPKLHKSPSIVLSNVDGLCPKISWLPLTIYIGTLNSLNILAKSLTMDTEGSGLSNKSPPWRI